MHAHKGEFDDEQLVRLAAAGDGAALAMLLQRSETALAAYIVRRLSRRARQVVDPDDVAQETCYEACRLIGSFVSQGTGSFTRWLLRIADLRIKAAIQKYRSRRTYPLSGSLGEQHSLLNALEQLRVYRRTPSTSAAAHEFALKIEESLAHLSSEHQQVITLRFLKGLSVSETAEIMCRRAPNIHMLSFRALQALRLQLRSLSHYA
jgi:RNA polymerase sigma-70 factor (ECF subfamily)